MEEKQIRNTQQHAVPIPLWLQKRMVRNLEQAAKNKVSPSRAKCAKAILQTLAEENKLAHTNTPLVAKPTVAGTGNRETAACCRTSAVENQEGPQGHGYQVCRPAQNVQVQLPP